MAPQQIVLMNIVPIKILDNGSTIWNNFGSWHFHGIHMIIGAKVISKVSNKEKSESEISKLPILSYFVI